MNTDVIAAPERFQIQLEKFEGPLDLLLTLIQKHELDIFDIPIAFITEKYLEHLALMEAMDLDVAGEFLVMAATLAHIKSRMLLPRPEPEVDEGPQEDPREALVRRLLEYQKYKQAGEELASMNHLDKDVFTRRASPAELRRSMVPAEGDIGLAEVSVFKLVEALDRTLKIAKIVIPHEVMVERISVAERIAELVDELRAHGELSFFQTFAGLREKGRIVATFLAILEMARLKLIRVRQPESEGDIVITSTGDDRKLETIDDYA
jgi:segregation and condensation protein A